MIRTINFPDPAAVTRHDRMVLLVERILTLHKQLPESLARLTKNRPSKRPDRGHGRADRSLVYELYGLTEEEIEIVDGREVEK